MPRAIALLLTVFTGFTGLVYEVAWQKYLGTLLGSQSEATAAILGIFLGGLSLGYSLFGRVTAGVIARADRTGRAPRLLLLYGLVEGGIGIYALLFPWLFAGVQVLSLAIPHAAGGAGFALDVALTALLIGPPTVLMGGTIPVLTQALARGLHDATRFHAFVYAANTAGAFAGALAAGFVLVPWLGLTGVLVAMGCANLAAGAGFAALGLFTPASASTVPPAPRDAGAVPPVSPAGFIAYATVALLSGFAMMAIQTVLNRIGALAFGASQFTFSMVVAVFVLSIALGSLAVSALRRVRPVYLVASQWALVALLALLYFVLPDAPYWAHVLRSLFRDNDAAFYPYYVSAFACVLAVLALPVGISGATLPLLFHHLRGQVADLGGVAGRLYSWNTVGSLLGALLGGYVLLAVLDLHHVYRIAVGALAAGATILTVRLAMPSARVGAGVVLLAVLGLLAALPAWRPERLSAGVFRNRQPGMQSYDGPDAFFRALNAEVVIRFHDDDPVNTVAVKEYTTSRVGLSRSIVNNGKSDGAIPIDYPTMELIAILPALLADRCERVLVIGYGTGVTAGELAALPATREVQVAEISSGVLAAASLFDYGSQNASRNPKIRVIQSDAYRALRRSPDRFDVIASEPSNPWVTGVEMLYSREFLQAAREHLTPGGVYLQWFHAYETNAETVAIVLRTFASVFDQMSVWFTMGTDLVIVGFNGGDHSVDVGRLAARAAAPEVVAALSRAGVSTFADLVAHEVVPVGVIGPDSFPGEPHTLLHPILSYQAARSFFRGGATELPPTFGPASARAGAENSLLRRWAAGFGGILPEAERTRVLEAVCPYRPVLCATLFAQWESQAPNAPALADARAAWSAQPALADTLRTDLSRELARLFGVGGEGARAVSVAEAARATALFTRFYHHAAPFDRRALAHLWRACRDADQSRCATGLAEAEAQVGSLREAAASPAQR